MSKDGLYAYMHLLAWPEGHLVVSSPLAIKAGSDITMLGHKAPLKWELNDNRLIVHISDIEEPCEHAWVLKLSLDD